MGLTETLRRIARRVRNKLIGAQSPLPPGPQHFGANVVLSSLYQPMEMERAPSGKHFWNKDSRGLTIGSDGLPLPPPDLRMGHAGDDAGFLAAGAQSAQWIRRICAREGLELNNATVLDWGCATGRVLRQFKNEAANGEYWGCDQHGPSLRWSRSFLSPPFKFVTCTEFPHLPFEDRTFDLIYGLSVFTHVLHLADTWLMELRRILKPGGLLLVTIHDEHTRDLLHRNTELGKSWIANGWWVDEDFSRGLENRIEINTQGRAWGQVTTFFRRDEIEEQWGRYYEVRSFEPESESYQTAVILKKAT